MHNLKKGSATTRKCGWHFPCTCKPKDILVMKGNTAQQKTVSINSVLTPASLLNPWRHPVVHKMTWVAIILSTCYWNHVSFCWFFSVFAVSEAKLSAWHKANFTKSVSNINAQILAQSCFQLQADRGYVYLLLLWSCCHLLFLISQPCNPVQRNDGWWCWHKLQTFQRPTFVQQGIKHIR